MQRDPIPGQEPMLTLRRDTHLFSRDPALAGRLESLRREIPLAPDQLLHAECPAIYVVRLGKLRVTQFLSDGREVTRAVLQAGAGLETQAVGVEAPDPAADRYPLDDIVLTALGDAELWSLPPGSLDNLS